MDFARNKWNATLDGVPLATGVSITSDGSLPAKIADIDAVWGLQDTNFPGNN